MRPDGENCVNMILDDIRCAARVNLLPGSAIILLNLNTPDVTSFLTHKRFPVEFNLMIPQYEENRCISETLII